MLLQYVIDQNTEYQSAALSISEVEEYLSSKYPKLIYNINNDIFQNDSLTYEDKKSKVFEIITYLTSNLISYSINITDIRDKIIYQDNAFKFVQLFTNIKPSDNVISNYISDRIDVILTQIPVYVIPFIDYSQMMYIIKDFLQMLPMKDKVTIKLNDVKPISFMLYRELQARRIESIYNDRHIIISIPEFVEIQSVKESNLDLIDKTDITVESLVLSFEQFRNKLFSNLENTHYSRYNTFSVLGAAEIENVIKKYKFNIKELIENEITSSNPSYERIRDKSINILGSNNYSRNIIWDIANTYIY